MADNLTFEELWNELKEKSDETREVFEISETVSNIINSIVQARIDNGMTQRDLAAACGVKQSAIARMERLQAIPRLDTVIKIARKLNVRLYAESIPVEETVSETVSVIVSAAPKSSTLYSHRFTTALAAAAIGGLA